MTRAEKRNEKKKYGKDFASFCQILNRYFPDFSGRHFLIRYKDGNTPSPYIPLFMPAPEPFSVAKQFSS